MSLADPLDVPVELIEYLAEQLDIEDPFRRVGSSCTERDKTRLEGPVQSPMS
jgi:hypothetical protein